MTSINLDTGVSAFLANIFPTVLIEFASCVVIYHAGKNGDIVSGLRPKLGELIPASSPCAVGIEEVLVNDQYVEWFFII